MNLWGSKLLEVGSIHRLAGPKYEFIVTWTSKLCRKCILESSNLFWAITLLVF